MQYRRNDEVETAAESKEPYIFTANFTFDGVGVQLLLLHPPDEGEHMFPQLVFVNTYKQKIINIHNQERMTGCRGIVATRQCGLQRTSSTRPPLLDPWVPGSQHPKASQ